MKKIILFFSVFFFSFSSVPLFSAERGNSTLIRILESLAFGRRMIDARRAYDLALIGQRYQHLQWWRPSLIIGNDFIYPYESGPFDDLMTANTSTLFLALPLATGTTIELSTGYVINRNKTEMMEWGFSQDLQGSIGIRQSLNPWWLRTRRNPYRSGALLQAEIARTEYNISMRDILFSCLTRYIELRRAERQMKIVIERIYLYNNMLESYMQMLLDGSISMRQFQSFRNDKWQHEQAFLSLEQNIMALRNELYELSGVQVEMVSDEYLIDINADIWLSLFFGVRKTTIAGLDERKIELQKTGLYFENLIFRQNMAPSVRVEFGSTFLLPAQETNRLDDAWRRRHFFDNELNNWAVNVSVDLSNLLSPVIRRHNHERRVTEGALSALSGRLVSEREAARVQNNNSIYLLETHIDWLVAILENDNRLMQDIAVLYQLGGISRMEYRMMLIDYMEKRYLLDNFYDELWLRRFMRLFY